MALKSIPYRVPLHPCNYELFQFTNKISDSYYIVMCEARKNAQRFGALVTYYNWRTKVCPFEGTIKNIELLRWADLSSAVKTELKKQNPELFMQFETAYLYQLQTVQL
jgi:hypothetical protein